MTPRNRSLSVPIGNICPCPCHGITAETVLDAAIVRPDQVHRMTMAVKSRSAVFFLIIIRSLVFEWAKDYNNIPGLRHDPHVLRLGPSVTRTRMSALRTCPTGGTMPGIVQPLEGLISRFMTTISSIRSKRWMPRLWCGLQRHSKSLRYSTMS